MNIILPIDNRKFSLNGIAYLKNYISRVAGNNVIVFNCYDNRDVLIEYDLYSNYTVNGETFESAAALQEALLDVIYSRNNLTGVADQDNIDIRKYFNIGAVDLTNIELLALINDIPAYTVSETESVWFLSRSTVQQTPGFLPPVYKIKMMRKGKGTYGAGQTQLVLADIELIRVSTATIADIENDPATDIIPYGDLVGTTVSDWLNAMPGIEIQPQDEGYTLFTGTIDEVELNYLWIGAAGTYGAGDLQSTDADFQVIPNSVPTGIPTYQQTLEQYNVSVDVPAVHEDTGNESKISRNGSGETFQKDIYTTTLKYEDPTGNFEILMPAVSEDTKLATRIDISRSYRIQVLIVSDSDNIQSDVLIGAESVDMIASQVAGVVDSGFTFHSASGTISGYDVMAGEKHTIFYTKA